MARLFDSGFEWNMPANLGEWETGSAIAPTITTTHPRSGSYEARFPLTTGVNSTSGFSKAVYVTKQQRIAYVRAGLYVATDPNKDVGGVIYVNCDTNVGGGQGIVLRLTSARKLRAFKVGGAQIGADSAALPSGSYVIAELMVDTINDIVIARLEGTEFVNATGVGITTSGGGFTQITIGLGIQGICQGDIYMDDVAINDDTGSFENSWPSGDKIGALVANGAGDNTGWTPRVAPTNWECVDERPPNDATDYVESLTLDAIDDYALATTPAAVAADDTIVTVCAYCRYRQSSIFGGALMANRIKAVTGGTVEEGPALGSPGTTWTSYDLTAPPIPKLRLYDLPGASTVAWKKDDLDAAQVGARISTGHASRTIQLSQTMLQYDHVAAAAPATQRRRMLAQVV